MRIPFLILAFGLLLAGAAVFSQTSLPFSVRGVIYGPAGAAQPGVAVTLTDDAGKFQQTAITDQSGLYSFSAPPGKYTLLVKPPQPFQEERISPVAVTSTLVTNQETHLKLDPRIPNFTEPSADSPGVSPAISVPVPSKAEKKRRPSFSLLIRMTNNKKTVPAGAAIKIIITMKNVSRSQIFFEAAPGVPQLSGFLPDVRDSLGQPVPLTYQGKKYFYAGYTTTSDIFIPIEPGKTTTREIDLDKLFDLTHPGQYKIRVVRSDTQAKTVVKSNFLKLKLTPLVARRPSRWSSLIAGDSTDVIGENRRLHQRPDRPDQTCQMGMLASPRNHKTILNWSALANDFRTFMLGTDAFEPRLSAI